MNCMAPFDRSVFDREENDFYPTPAWATLALLDKENFEGAIADFSCGDGELILALHHRFGKSRRLIASDLIDRGFGHTPYDIFELDDRAKVDNVIMNPPFGPINEIIPKALHLGQKKVALLARLALLEGQERFKIFEETPPSRIHVFTERVTMYSRKAELEMMRTKQKKNGSTTACAWFVWDFGSEDRMKTTLIPPGRKHVYKTVSDKIRGVLVERALERARLDAERYEPRNIHVECSDQNAFSYAS